VRRKEAERKQEAAGRARKRLVCAPPGGQTLFYVLAWLIIVVVRGRGHAFTIQKVDAESDVDEGSDMDFAPDEAHEPDDGLSPAVRELMKKLAGCDFLLES
jgi:hypothetical protein